MWWLSGGVGSEEDELWSRKGGSLSAKEASWAVSLLVLSNQPAASLLSPELWLCRCRRGETLEGGLALSLAGALGEVLSVVDWRPGPARWDWDWDRDWDRDWDWDWDWDLAGGLCRSETDSCAGGRRGCRPWAGAGAGTVAGRSSMSRGSAAAGAKGRLWVQGVHAVHVC